MKCVQKEFKKSFVLFIVPASSDTVSYAHLILFTQKLDAIALNLGSFCPHPRLYLNFKYLLCFQCYFSLGIQLLTHSHNRIVQYTWKLTQHKICYCCTNFWPSILHSFCLHLPVNVHYNHFYTLFLLSYLIPCQLARLKLCAKIGTFFSVCVQNGRECESIQEEKCSASIKICTARDEDTRKFYARIANV